MSRKRDEAIAIPHLPWPEFKERFLAWCLARRVREVAREIEEDGSVDN